jgi:hypothetical protein
VIELARNPNSDRTDGLDRNVRRRLAVERAGGGPQCPKASIIAAYCDQALGLAERSFWERHFAQCARCAGTLAAFARLDDAVELPGSARNEFLTDDVRRWWTLRSVLPVAAFGAMAAVLAMIALKTFTTDTTDHASLNLRAKAESRAPQSASNTVAADATTRAAPESRDDRSVIAMNEATLVKPAASPQSLAKNALSRSPAASPGAGAARRSERDRLFDEKTRASELKQRNTQIADAPAMPALRVGIGGPTAAEPSGPPAQSPVVATAPSAGLGGTTDSAHSSASAQSPEVAAAPSVGLGGAFGSAPSIAPPQAPALPLPPSIVAEGAAGVTTGPAARTRESAGAAETTMGGGVSAIGRGTGALVGAGTGAIVDASRGASAIAVEPPDHSAVWMVGAHGAISRYSHAAGWAPQASGVTVDLMAGSAPSASICWIVGRAGTILRTLDGDHWSKIDAPVSDDLSSVIAGNATDATIAAADGRRFSTSDGGVTWRPL